MAFWNITGGSQVTTFDANGNAVGTDIDQGSIRHAGNIGETTKFTDVGLGEGNPFITVPSGVDYVDPVNGTLPVTSFNLTNSGSMEDSNKGIAVYQNQLYRTHSASVITRYDPTTDLSVQQNLANLTGGGFQEYTDMVVFQNRLLHMGQGNQGYIHELVGGSWVRRRTFTTGNISVSPSIFESFFPASRRTFIFLPLNSLSLRCRTSSIKLRRFIS